MTDDKELIEELRRRGYFVYPKDHVRVFGSQHVIDERDMRSTEIKDYIRHKLALQIGEGLHEAGALTETSDRIGIGEIIRVNCVVVMPGAWP
jgi:hypothetical protein